MVETLAGIAAPGVQLAPVRQDQGGHGVVVRLMGRGARLGDEVFGGVEAAEVEQHPTRAPAEVGQQGRQSGSDGPRHTRARRW